MSVTSSLTTTSRVVLPNSGAAGAGVSGGGMPCSVVGWVGCVVCVVMLRSRHLLCRGIETSVDQLAPNILHRAVEYVAKVVGRRAAIELRTLSR